MTVRTILYETVNNRYIEDDAADKAYVTSVVGSARFVQYLSDKHIYYPVTDTVVYQVGIQGPPGPAANAGWTYIAEATPAGDDSETWFKPSVGYGYVFRAGLGWQRFLFEDMLADSADHNLDANGGYY